MSTKALAFAFISVLMAANVAFAVPSIGMIDEFGTGVSYDDWYGQDLLENPVTLNEDGVVLEIAIPEGPPPGTVIAWTTDDDWKGSYVLPGGTAIRFELSTVDSDTPSALSLYFESGIGLNAHRWAYTGLTPGFGAFGVNIGQYSGFWVAQNFLPVDPGTDFYADIQDIQHIGIYLSGTDAGGTYYLDNFEIAVVTPEPETVWMIMAIVLSLAVTFRGKLTEVAGQLKARFAKI